MRNASKILSVVELGFSLTLFILGIIHLDIHSIFGGPWLGFGIYGIIGSIMCLIALHNDSKAFGVVSGIINIAFPLVGTVLSIFMFVLPSRQYVRRFWKGRDGYISKNIRIPKKIALFTFLGLLQVGVQTVTVYPVLPQLCETKTVAVTRDPIKRECTLVKFVMVSTKSTLPHSYGGFPITKLIDGFVEDVHERAMQVELTVPESYKEISKRCFKKCTTFRTINLPDSIEKIDDEAFSTTQFGTLHLSDSLKTIGNRAFYNCTLIGNLTFSDTITSIGEEAFFNCARLREIHLPATNIKTIGSNAFGNISNCHIYLDIDEIPSGWASDWNGSATYHLASKVN